MIEKPMPDRNHSEYLPLDTRNEIDQPSIMLVTRSHGELTRMQSIYISVVCRLSMSLSSSCPFSVTCLVYLSGYPSTLRCSYPHAR